MKYIRIYTLFATCILFFSGHIVNAKVHPVVISEVFYDSPNNEDYYLSKEEHHNGEFIELFNPTMSDINLTGWSIKDYPTSYSFPKNTIIPARGVIIVAYKYPNSNFKLSDLFPSINSLDPQLVQKNILYHSAMMLNNKMEEISLYDNNQYLIDRMSYAKKNSSSVGWNLNATNGSYKGRGNIPRLMSIQRKNIHNTFVSITAIDSDYVTADATPLQTYSKISEYPVLETLYGYREIDTDSNVGAIPGYSSVTPAGGAAYQIPIELPAGTNGMQPQISIAYNSQGSFGALGMGWDIGGLSSISRGLQSFYFDESANGTIDATTIKFNNTDRIYLDGKRLIQLNGAGNFETGTEYGMEVEDYSRIKIEKSSETGLIYFVLTTKEGQTVEYGQTANSILKNRRTSDDDRILAWKINKITDVYGNSITYEYSDNGQHISKINYINNSIEFKYITNTLNPQQRYIGDFLTKQDKLLETITIKQNSTKINTYDFGYLYSNMDMRLSGISLSGSDGKRMNPTKIEWGKENGKIEEVILNKMWDGNLNNVTSGHLYTGDIDGDGYSDRIEMWEGNQGSDELGYIAVTLKGNKTLPLIRFPATNTSFKHFKPSLVIGDINGDGKDEIMLFLPFASTIGVVDKGIGLIDHPELGLNVFGINSNNTTLIKTQHFNYSRDNSIPIGTALILNGIQSLAPIWNTGENYGYLSMLLNMNNDKYPDLVIIPYRNDQKDFDSEQKYIIDVYYGSPKGLSIHSHYEKEQYFRGQSNPIIGDFNADGIVDIFKLSLGSNYRNKGINTFLTEPIHIENDLYSSPRDLFDSKKGALFEELYHIDINNDGDTDVLARQGNTDKKKWLLLENIKTRSGFTFSSQELDLHNFWKGKGGNLEGDYAIPIDYNGDGLIDLIIADDWRASDEVSYIDYEATRWYFYKNTGGKYKLEYQFGGDKHFKYENSRLAGLSLLNPVVMDINNDGIADLVFGDRQGDLKNRYYKAFTMYGANKRNVVHSISNGLGQTEEFTYKYFTDYNQQEQDLSNPVRDLKAPIMVVDTYTDALGTKTTYSYSKPQTHIEGKGFLGYETVSAINSTAKIKTVSTYEYDKVYYNVSLKHQEVFSTMNNKILSSTHITNTMKPIDAKRYFPQITEQTSIDYLTDITKKTKNKYNNDGTLSEIETITGNQTIRTKYLDYKKRNDKGLVAYLPQRIEVTQERAGATTITDITDFTYYEVTGMPYTSKEHVGKYGETLTTNTYYPKGTLKTVSVKPKNIEESVTTYTYTGDNYFLFPLNIKTTVSNTDLSNISYTYDYTTGNVKTKTDNIIGQTTTYEYNSFGRMTKEILPSGATTLFVTSWDSSFENAVYKKEAQSLDINHNSTVYYDKHGREVYSEMSGWKGKTLFSKKQYNATTGLLEKVIHPRYQDEPEKYTTYSYADIANRMTSETFFDGVNMLTTSYNYTYGSRKTSVTTPDKQTKTTEVDASGLVVKITDNGGIIEYKNHNANGQPQTITSNGSTTSIEYDEMGRKKKLTDPNAGTIEYSYYADGQLKEQISAKGDITEMKYDEAGRLKTKTITDVNGNIPVLNVTTYTYIPNDKKGARQVDKIEQTLDGVLSHSKNFSYNEHQQISAITEKFDGQSVTTSYGYDALWRPVTTASPGAVITDVYNTYGDIYQVKVGNELIWEGKEQNSAGQWLEYTLGNGLQTNQTYTNRHEIETIKTGINNKGTNTAGIQNLVYKYDAPTGNLLSRQDNRNNRNEEFAYDALDRLTKASLNGVVQYEMTYMPNGNIDTKSDVGIYQYNTPRPNAMSGISNVQAGVSSDKQFITYTPFNKVNRIQQGVDNLHITEQYDISYGLDEQRIKTVYTSYIEGKETKQTRYYFGTYEKTYKDNNIIQKINYIYTPAGLTAITSYNDTEDVTHLYYIHTDQLGSILVLTDRGGGIVKEYAYTPWGGRITLSGGNFDITDRGYTGHEHIFAPNNSTQGFGLINMNGRIYDPVLARFLSPDPYVQAPDYTQSFNRYTYCSNNPFKYTDPSGELQIGPFYVSLNLGWGYNSGFSIGISAGVGIENIASAGISIGYNTSGSFTFSASAGIAGFYANAGYDTKGGWFAGAGWSAPLPSLGIVSFNTNFTSVGVSYSQKGGLSGNYMGMQISKNGVSFNPSVGVGIELYYYDKNNYSVYSGEGGSAKARNHQFYDVEVEAWNDMYNNAIAEDREYGALITAKGIIQAQLGPGGGDVFLDLPISRILGRSYVTFEEKRYLVLGNMHIHQRDGYPKEFDRWIVDGKGDYASIKNLNDMIFFLMSIDKKLHGMRYNEGYYRELDRLNTNLESLLDGSFSLIPYTIKYHKTHRFDYQKFLKK